MTPLAEFATTFGYVHIKGLFDLMFWDGKEQMLDDSPDECIRAFMEYPAVLHVAHELIGDELAETGENHQYDLYGHAYDSWHYDAPASPADGWMMPLWRFGVYFRDYTKHSGGLQLSPGSHHGPMAIPASWNAIRAETEPRDLFIWNLRTFHAAHADNEGLPVAEPRRAIFFDYGAPGRDLDGYVNFRRSKHGQH